MLFNVYCFIRFSYVLLVNVHLSSIACCHPSLVKALVIVLGIETTLKEATKDLEKGESCSYCIKGTIKC